MPKCTCRAEVLLKSEKIDPIGGLAVVIELCLSEGISQAVSKQKIPLNKKINFVATFWKCFGSN